MSLCRPHATVRVPPVCAAARRQGPRAIYGVSSMPARRRRRTGGSVREGERLCSEFAVREAQAGQMRGGPSGIRDQVVSFSRSLHSILPCQGEPPRGLCLFCLRGGRARVVATRSNIMCALFSLRDAAFHRAEEEGRGRGRLGFAEVIFVASMRVWRRVALLSFLLAAPPTPSPSPHPFGRVAKCEGER